MVCICVCIQICSMWSVCVWCLWFVVFVCICVVWCVCVLYMCVVCMCYVCVCCLVSVCLCGVYTCMHICMCVWGVGVWCGLCAVCLWYYGCVWNVVRVCVWHVYVCMVCGICLWYIHVSVYMRVCAFEEARTGQEVTLVIDFFLRHISVDLNVLVRLWTRGSGFPLFSSAQCWGYDMHSHDSFLVCA